MEDCVYLKSKGIIFTSQESFPPSLYPAQMKMWGMCSRKPAFSYINSHSVLLMMGSVTFCILDGRGPSERSWVEKDQSVMVKKCIIGGGEKGGAVG